MLLPRRNLIRTVALFILKAAKHIPGGHMKRFACLLLCLSMTACSAGRSADTRLASFTTCRTTYLEGVRRQANVGDIITSSREGYVFDALDLSGSAAANTTHKGRQINVTLRPGTYVLEAADAGGQYFVTLDPLEVTYDGELMEATGGLYLPGQDLGQPSAYWDWGYSPSFVRSVGVRSGTRRFFVAPLSTAPAYVKRDHVVMRSDYVGFVSTLTYAGVAGGKVTFVYKEFSGGYARPAYTQEVTLDYTPGETYAYKEARFIVHSASATMIDYTLVKHM